MMIRSIGLRLVVSATIWIAATLVVTGIILTGLFRVHAARTLDAALIDQVDEIASLIVVEADGRVRLKRHPVDPRFVKPRTGWYYEIVFADGLRERSRSLAGEALQGPGIAIGKMPTNFDSTGPWGAQLHAIGKTFTLPGATSAFAVLVTGPAAEIDLSVREFMGVLSLTLAALGLGLIVAVLAQVRYGLRPLRRILKSLNDIRVGRADRLEGPFPSEIQPLADQLSALLDHNKAVIERVRNQADAAAHALKTPLAVVTNEADRVGGPAGDTIRQQAALMNERLNHFLSHARVAGARDILGALTSVESVIAGLERTLRHIHHDRGVDIRTEGMEGLVFRGEQQDLEEMLGNLMDNACKWARREVRIHGRRDYGYLFLTVEDDGPGIPDGSLNDVVDRGRRLDASIPGSGIGLAIVRDAAELYGGVLTLERSPLGGLSARLRLPSA